MNLEFLCFYNIKFVANFETNAELAFIEIMNFYALFHLKEHFAF